MWPNSLGGSGGGASAGCSGAAASATELGSLAAAAAVASNAAVAASTASDLFGASGFSSAAHAGHHPHHAGAYLKTSPYVTALSMPPGIDALHSSIGYPGCPPASDSYYCKLLLLLFVYLGCTACL